MLSMWLIHEDAVHLQHAMRHVYPYQGKTWGRYFGAWYFLESKSDFYIKRCPSW